MNFNKLFNMQLQLDKRIKEEHSLHNENLFERKILALQVELGELANETRCFKFWSKKPSANDDVILEEYVDGIHFILSLGLECGFEQSVQLQESSEDLSLVQQFNLVFQKISEFRNNQELKVYLALFNQYLHLGKLLRFTFKQIEEAYMMKNEVNHQRQDEGY